MTRLSCHRFRSNEVRLWLSVIAYNLGNLWRRLVLPRRIGGMRNSSFSRAVRASSADSAICTLIALAVQDGLQGKAHVPFVVNDQDRGKGQAHEFILIKIRGGNSRVKRVPLPGSDCTRTTPPYISELCLTMARPRPVPLARVVK